MGGILTDLLSWEWIFFVNVPVGIAGLVLAPILLSESRDAHGQSHDVPGAVLVTGGLSVLVLGITQGQQWGWGSAATIGAFVASAVLLVAFALWEQRQEHPLVPFSIFRLQTLTAVDPTPKPSQIIRPHHDGRPRCHSRQSTGLPSSVGPGRALVSSPNRPTRLLPALGPPACRTITALSRATATAARAADAPSVAAKKVA